MIKQHTLARPSNQIQITFCRPVWSDVDSTTFALHEKRVAYLSGSHGNVSLYVMDLDTQITKSYRNPNRLPPAAHFRRYEPFLTSSIAGFWLDMDVFWAVDKDLEHIQLPTDCRFVTAYGSKIFAYFDDAVITQDPNRGNVLIFDTVHKQESWLALKTWGSAIEPDEYDATIFIANNCINTLVFVTEDDESDHSEREEELASDDEPGLTASSFELYIRTYSFTGTKICERTLSCTIDRALDLRDYYIADVVEAGPGRYAVNMRADVTRFTVVMEEDKIVSWHFLDSAVCWRDNIYVAEREKIECRKLKYRWTHKGDLVGFYKLLTLSVNDYFMIATERCDRNCNGNHLHVLSYKDVGNMDWTWEKPKDTGIKKYFKHV